MIEWLIFISVFSCFIEYIYKDIKSIKFTDCEIVRENDSRIKAYGNIYEIEAGRILYRTEPEQYVVEKQEGVKYIIGKWKIKEIRKQIIKKYPDIYNGEFWVFEFKISKHWGYFKGFQENTVYAIVIRNELINEIKYDEKNGKAWINGKSLQSFFTSIS